MLTISTVYKLEDKYVICIITLYTFITHIMFNIRRKLISDCLFLLSLQMKRTRGQKAQIIVISSSSSENESKDSSTDELYVPTKRSIRMGKKKGTLISDDVPCASSRKRKCSIQPTTKGKKQAITDITCKNLIVDPITQIKESINSQHNVGVKNIKQQVKDINKRNTKQILPDINDISFNSVECNEWTDVDYISEVNNVEKHIAENVIKLLNNDNTIPFIARYRRNETGSMEPDKLRAIKESLDHVKVIKARANTILKNIDKLGLWTPNVYAAVVSAKCLDDLEHIYSLFKPASKRTLSERAKELGLEPVSLRVLQGEPLPSLSSIIDPNKDGLKTEQQIKNGIIHIIADVINKDKTLFDKVKNLQSESYIKIQTTQHKVNNKNPDNTENDIQRKYEMYYNFDTNNRNIKPHQILAINRGEAQKILSVKIIVPDSFETRVKTYCYKQYTTAMSTSQLHYQLLNDSIEHVYTKCIKPLVIRRVKTEMKEKAEVASIEVFVNNVKQLLLTPPVRGKRILGIDPGFFHGCKLAVISEQGEVLETAVIYPHKNSKMSYDKSAKVLTDMVKKYKCSVLALGNATACRETELFINELIKSGAFGSANVVYTIVDEAGSSIYSCSSEAKSEFPDLDTNVISAVSIARRLQDPLAELVKVEPKHLGVGMYQHDLPEKQLSHALNEVISEAVSFIGVDVNTASQCLLKRVAGLNATRANNIIEWRTKFGPFKNRSQLLDVKGIGNKIFEQCAGFIRILSETAIINGLVDSNGSEADKYKFNLLDQTWIHPESYKIAERFLDYCNCNIRDLGTTMFIEKIKSHSIEGYDVLSKKCGTNETTMEIIVKGLSMRKDEDIRLDSRTPIFRNSTLTINDISVGVLLTGVIRNVTHFGAFVDIGVGRDGLVPTKWLKNCTVSIGQRVKVKVLTVDIERNRINLELINVS